MSLPWRPKLKGPQLSGECISHVISQRLPEWQAARVATFYKLSAELPPCPFSLNSIGQNKSMTNLDIKDKL